MGTRITWKGHRTTEKQFGEVGEEEAAGVGTCRRCRTFKNFSRILQNAKNSQKNYWNTLRTEEDVKKNMKPKIHPEASTKRISSRRQSGRINLKQSEKKIKTKIQTFKLNSEKIQGWFKIQRRHQMWIWGVESKYQNNYKRRGLADVFFKPSQRSAIFKNS